MLVAKTEPLSQASNLASNLQRLQAKKRLEDATVSSPRISLELFQPLSSSQPHQQRLPTPAADKRAESFAKAQPETVDPAQQAPQTSVDDKQDNFSRWRPSYHMLATRGWMNDPCGASFDPTTGLYHLYYQWNPKGSTWGNMSWGHSVSKDLVHWRTSEEAVLRPGQEEEYDKEGVFTGCVLMSGLQGRKDEGEMTAIYTAVSKLPIHHTLPYNRGSEKLAVSTSNDGGKTWRAQGLIFSEPPEESHIISWRDPYIEPWKSLDDLLLDSQVDQGPYYGLIAGGIKDVTPTCFLYSIPKDDLKAWKPLGPLCNVGRNAVLEPFATDLGQNWEVCNFFSLPSNFERQGEGQLSRDYLLVNAEGCDEANGPKRQSIWMECRLEKSEDGKVEMVPKFGAPLDFGCVYASSTFWDPVKGRRIMWGWVTEDDLSESYYETQGWSGSMTLPRELFTLPTLDEKGRNLLGIRPIEEVEKLRIGSVHTSYGRVEINENDAKLPDDDLLVKPLEIGSRSWEFQAEVEVQSSSSKTFGLILAHSSGYEDRTVLSFDPATSKLTLDRSRSSPFPEASKEPVSAPVPFPQVEGEGQTKKKLLKLRVLLDNSILEVFANDCVALTSRIYPCQVRKEADSSVKVVTAEGLVGLSLFSSKSDGQHGVQAEAEAEIQFDKVETWEGLSKAELGDVSE
ncbi:Arabinanase/levansucrase/invertase [Violaceomyces palustris]|uniref:Arabinanase/levansucrase/invertase n=1 Tax=Violaceomyces palustris TaxID=1673888 RepID=A0ACD0NLP1_9BASI|nr:Arabinanase/levansucrase/invertase [Violaceomyces palustris]